MIFGIHSSILDNLNENSDNFDDIIELLDILATLIKNKKHILDLSRNDLMKILSINKHLSKSSQKVYKYLATHFFRFTENLEKKVIITLMENNIVLQDNIYYVPLHTALSVDFFNINFVTEDINDKNFFIYIATSYYKNSFSSNPTFYFNFKNGGGNRCSCIIEDCHLSNSITVSILDSDKKFPNCHFGNTASSVDNFNVSNTSSIVDKIFLSVREAENLIPLFFYEKNMKLNFDAKLSTVNSVAPNHLNYFDFKEGLTAQKLLNNPDKFEFWKPIICDTFSFHNSYPDTLIFGSGDSTLATFLQLIDSRYLPFQINQCEKVHPTNTGIQNKIIQLKNLQFFVNNPYNFLDERLKSHWNSIGTSISSWFIGYPNFIA